MSPHCGANIQATGYHKAPGGREMTVNHSEFGTQIIFHLNTQVIEKLVILEKFRHLGQL
jgi:hypothetical protein